MKATGLEDRVVEHQVVQLGYPLFTFRSPSSRGEPNVAVRPGVTSEPATE